MSTGNQEVEITPMRALFESGITRPEGFRRGRLRALLHAIDAHELRLHKALHADLRKSPAEAFLTETGFVQSDIRYTLRHMHRWMQPRRVAVPAGLHPARARVAPEPKGVILVIGPWNYPVQLTLAPLVSALAAGNCAVIKPSEQAPASAAALRDLIEDTFDRDLVRVVEGDPERAGELLKQPFDHLFFTGGTENGRRVAIAAAERHIPFTLELGGKSPAIAGRQTDPAVAARRIVHGKFMNAGQTCVAPDHLWVPRPLLPAFLDALQAALRSFYGADPQKSPDYGRIIHRRHLDRLQSLLDGLDPVCGGQADADDLYLAPTIVCDPPCESRLMREEIFGPILPVLPYDDEEEVIAFCKTRSTPLALYLFTNDRAQRERLMNAIPSGGICINDTVQQLIPKELPFGGRGASGTGVYHGRAGFDTFSHPRSMLTRTTRIDPLFVYPPLTLPLRTLRRVSRFFSGA